MYQTEYTTSPAKSKPFLTKTAPSLPLEGKMSSAHTGWMRWKQKTHHISQSVRLTASSQEEAFAQKVF